jgi:hypothetical protein
MTSETVIFSASPNIDIESLMVDVDLFMALPVSLDRGPE